MARLCDWIEEMADGEAVEAVVIGNLESDPDWRSEEEEPEHPYQRVVLSWEAALPHISYEFEEKSNVAQCHAIVAWTASWVISIGEYDGNTEPIRIPRNPRGHLPETL